MVKFPNKAALEKIIEYINFESSNKYTLVLSYATTTKQQPQPQQQASRSSHHGSKSPNPKDRKPSQPRLSGDRKSSETRKKSSGKQQLSPPNGLSTGDEINGSNSSEILDQVLSKVFDCRLSLAFRCRIVLSYLVELSCRISPNMFSHNYILDSKNSHTSSFLIDKICLLTLN